MPRHPWCQPGRRLRPRRARLRPPPSLAPPDPVVAEGGAPVRSMPASASGEGLALFAFMMALAALHVVMRWPSPLGQLVQPWLLALIFVRVARWLVRLSFRLPDASRLPGAERFWLSRLTLLATVLAAGWALSRSMAVVGAPIDHVILLRYATGLALIVFSAMTIWQQPSTPAERAASRPRRLFLTVWLVLLAVLELMGTTLLFWIGVYVAGLPLLLRQVTRIVHGTGGTRAADGAQPTGAAGPLRIVLLDRAVRAAVITLAMMWLGWIVRHHPAGAVMQDETLAMLSQGLLRGIVVLLLADLAWQAIRVWVDATLARPLDEGDAVARAREARLRTLLPLLRAALGVLILSISVMMVLAGLGVEIGPMIAGAGIFGVAIGFGSQTLVKDVISGIFYMLDDAFRVGEYIQSGSYKGTVEGFSLRSVRLRHHRGSVYVVPFGALGAVQNMSRDWAKDKFLITVPFETDVEKVRKLVKKVGEALRADPEFGPLFIEPMKMKGVEQFGDYGITLAVSMILRPSSLTATIRRRAYMMIRQAFQDNGIEFASPKVQVEGGAADEAAAAAIALAQRRAAEAAAAASA